MTQNEGLEDEKVSQAHSPLLSRKVIADAFKGAFRPQLWS